MKNREKEIEVGDNITFVFKDNDGFSTISIEVKSEDDIEKIDDFFNNVFLVKTCFGTTIEESFNQAQQYTKENTGQPLTPEQLAKVQFNKDTRNKYGYESFVDLGDGSMINLVPQR